jgi:hypothetical protein
MIPRTIGNKFRIVLFLSALPEQETFDSGGLLGMAGRMSVGG